MERCRRVNKALLLPGIGFLLGVSFAAAADDVGAHILSRMEGKAIAVQSYKASFDLWLYVGEDEFPLTGTTLFKWPKMLRVEMSLRDEEKLSQVLYMKDGVVWQYLPLAKVAFHRDEEALRKKFPEVFASQELLNIQDPFDLVEHQTLKFLEEERDKGETLYLFEGVPKKAVRHQGVLAPVLCRMRIAEKDGLLRDLFFYDKAGREILKQHFWDIQPNLELLDEEFIFKPEDVKLLEVTKQTEKKIMLFLKEESAP